MPLYHSILRPRTKELASQLLGYDPGRSHYVHMDDGIEELPPNSFFHLNGNERTVRWGGGPKGCHGLSKLHIHACHVLISNESRQRSGRKTRQAFSAFCPRCYFGGEIGPEYDGGAWKDHVDAEWLDALCSKLWLRSSSGGVGWCHVTWSE